jgi:hypothetical protein
VGALADSTPAAAAAPLALVMLLASVALPALLFRSTGVAAARLLGGGRSPVLGTAAAGLLALALALAVLAAGAGLAGAASIAGALIGVPVAVWVGIASLAPLRPLGPRARSALAIIAAVGVVLGWLLTDGLGAPGAHSVLLDAAGIALSGPWRGSPALGLAAAFVFGLAAAVVGRAAGRQDAAPARSRMRTEHPRAVDSVGE